MVTEKKRLEGSVIADILLGIGREFPVIRAWRNNAGAAILKGQLVQFGMPGQADISGLIAPYGRRLEIEAKRPKEGKQSEAQATFEAMIISQGGVYILATSWELARAYLLNALSEPRCLPPKPIPVTF